ncbi:MAG: diguanylate cyclase [Betaproteobacteria bacterium]|nr:diguanylate cyclase [Betaproteobacteria bacterium]
MRALPVILVADDVVENVRLLKNALQELGDVVFAHNGEDALTQAIRHRPEIILLDVGMPVLDGRQVCKRLKADEGTRDIPVIFITAAGAEEDEERGLAAGAIDYITKPFAPAIVRARVKNHLALVKANAAVREANDQLRKYKAAVDASSAGIVITDRQAVVEYANTAHAALTGTDPAALLGRALPVLAEPPSPAAASEYSQGELLAALRAGCAWRGEVPARRRDDTTAWEDVSVAPVKDAQGSVTHFVTITTDISERKAMEERLREMAVTDPLTGALNRRRFMELGEQEFHRTRRTGEPLSVLMLDIDHFKRVNDTRGHPAGDAVIRALADITKQSLRALDTVARLGGEEFAALLPMTPLAAAAEVGERIRAAVAASPVAWEDRPIAFTVSIGAAELQPTGQHFEALLASADQALYEAKHGGRNRVVARAPD